MPAEPSSKDLREHVESERLPERTQAQEPQRHEGGNAAWGVLSILGPEAPWESALIPGRARQVWRRSHGLVTVCHARRWERQSWPSHRMSHPALGEAVTTWPVSVRREVVSWVAAEGQQQGQPDGQSGTVLRALAHRDTAIPPPLSGRFLGPSSRT